MVSWPVVTQALVRRERWPGRQFTSCVPLVYAGQNVEPDQPLMRVDRIPPAGSSAADPRTHQQNSEIIPSGLRGRVVEMTQRGGPVIESRVTLLRGAFGASGQTAGILTMWSETGTDQEPLPIPPGAILVVPGPANFALLQRALLSGVAGIVAGSVPLPDLEGFLHTDLIALLNSRSIVAAEALLPPLTIMLTEGPGTFPMHARTIDLLHRSQGMIALLSGTTLPRKHLAPELLISLPPSQEENEEQLIQPEPTIRVGMQVRVCSGDRAGASGIVEYLFTNEQAFSSSIHARSVRLRLEDGSVLVTPLALIERVD